MWLPWAGTTPRVQTRNCDCNRSWEYTSDLQVVAPISLGHRVASGHSWDMSTLPGGRHLAHQAAENIGSPG